MNFATPMPDANYSAVVTGSFAPTVIGNTTNVSAKTVSSFKVDIVANNGSAIDQDFNFTVDSLNSLPPKGTTGTDAWGTCNPDGLINASFNVASVTKAGTGLYDVVFTTPMPTASYSVVVGGGSNMPRSLSATATGFRVETRNASATVIDSSFTFTVNATNAQLPNTVTQEQIEAAINNPGVSAWGRVSSTYVLEGSLNCTINRDGLSSGGIYNVVFDTPMPDANYSIVASADQESSAGLHCNAGFRNVTATGFQIVLSANQSLANAQSSFAVFATNALPPTGGTGADAWGAIDGTTGNLFSSFNASCSKVSTGVYQVTFNTPMPNSFYAPVVSSELGICTIGPGSVTANGFQINTFTNFSAGPADAYCTFQVHATNATLPETITTDQFNSALNAPTFRNILINGNLTINQRGVDIASVATGEYGQDRWKKTAGGMTQIVEDGNYLPSTPYTLSGTGITTTTASSPASGDWDISTTFGDIPVTARLIQLEYGNVASLFDLRPIASELALCQRYYQEHQFIRLFSTDENTGWRYITVPRTVTMRAAPTETGTFAAGTGSFGAKADAFQAECNLGQTSGGTQVSNYAADAEL